MNDAKQPAVAAGQKKPTPDARPLPERGATLAAAGVPLGAIIPRHFTDDSRLVVLNREHSAAAERYRRLCSRLEQYAPPGGTPPRVVLVTSAVPHEGKTTTALNLALASAEDRDRKVLLVDADLRRPSISRYVTPAPKLGMADVLTGGASLEHALVEPRNSRLTILPGGLPASKPLELLRSDVLGAVFGSLRRIFDTIIVDTPPAIPFADASVVLPHTDGALLVVRAKTTASPLVGKALEALEAGVVLGAVLNDVDITPVDRYYYRYDVYDPYAYAPSEPETQT